MMLEYLSYFLLVIVVVMFLLAAIRILREYERGIVFTLGRFTGVKGPGLIILIPFAQQMVKVDLRVVVQDVPPQDVITRDNVTVKVNAVLYFRIVDPERAIIRVADFLAATSQLAQTTLIVEAPDESSAMSLSLSLGALGNIRTESLRAFSATDMATIVGKMV